MRIGPYLLENPWILAPMAGVSEMPFRVISRRMGAAAAPTELISANGLVRGQKGTERYLRHDEKFDQPFWVQLFGGDPAAMAEAGAHAVAMGARIIDINMGCPVRKIAGRGAGSALLLDVRRAAAIVASMVDRLPVPITAKIRTGWDEHHNDTLQIVRALADAGVALVSVHGRTRAQGYGGAADWELIQRLVEKSPVPIVGNGDVFTPEQARRRLRETGCAAVMIGRGALGNPWIFRQLGGGSAPDGKERWRVVREHLLQHLAFSGASVGGASRGIRAFRSHLEWYSRGLVGAATFHRCACSLENLDELLATCRAFFLQATPDARALDPTACSLNRALG